MAAHQSTYPEPETSRFRNVPARDDSYVATTADGAEVTNLVRLADKKKKATDVAPPSFHLLVPLIREPLELGDTARFPHIDVFNEARVFLKDKCTNRPPGTFPGLDKKLLSNYKGYTQVATNSVYYLNETLRGRTQFHKSLFATDGYSNNVHHVIRAIKQLCARKKKDAEGQKQGVYLVCKLVFDAYCVINGRYLKQTPADREDYDVSKPAYLQAFFDQRDLHFDEAQTKQEVKAAMKRPEAFDLIAYATKRTYMETVYATVVYLNWAAAAAETLIEQDLLLNMCRRNIKEHPPMFIAVLGLRTVRVLSLCEQFNELLGAQSLTNGLKLNIEEKEASHINKTFILDTHRVYIHKTKNAISALADDTANQVNWTAALGFHLLLTGFSCDPARASFDTSAMAVRDRIVEKLHGDFETAVLDYATLFCLPHCKGVDTKELQKEWKAVAAPEVNSLQLRYAFFASDSTTRRMCFNPPLSNEPLLFDAHPLHYTKPCWEWLTKRAREAKDIEPDRMRLVLAEQRTPNDLPIVDGPFKGKYIQGPIPAHMPEVFEDLEQVLATFPLEHLMQIARDTGAIETTRASTTLRIQKDLVGDHMMPCTPRVPRPGAVPDKKSLNYAAYWRSTHGGQEYCRDSLVAALVFYMRYLQGCFLYRSEVQVIRYLLKSTALLDDSSVDTLRKTEQRLPTLQCGARLWNCMCTKAVKYNFKSLLGKTYTDARAALKERPDEWQSILVTGKQSLFAQGSFWKAYLGPEYLNLSIVKGPDRPAERQALQRTVIDRLCGVEEENKMEDTDGVQFGICLHQFVPRDHVRVFLPVVMDKELVKEVTVFGTIDSLVTHVRSLAMQEVITPLRVYYTGRHPRLVKYGANNKKWEDLPFFTPPAKNPSVVVELQATITKAAGAIKSRKGIDWKQQTELVLKANPDTLPASLLLLDCLKNKAGVSKNLMYEAVRLLLAESSAASDSVFSIEALEQARAAMKFAGVTDWNDFFNLIYKEFDRPIINNTLNLIERDKSKSEVAIKFVEHHHQRYATANALPQELSTAFLVDSTTTRRKTTQPQPEDFSDVEEDFDAKSLSLTATPDRGQKRKQQQQESPDRNVKKRQRENGIPLTPSKRKASDDDTAESESAKRARTV